MTFGERLRRAREARGLTRDQLAAASGVAYGTIHGYEIGRRAPSFTNVVRLAAVLGLTCQDFAGCSDVAPSRARGAEAEGAEEVKVARQPKSEIQRVKDAVRERDGFRCVGCGVTNDQHKAVFGRQLDVCRIDPESAYTVAGCETTCRACSIRRSKRQGRKKLQCRWTCRRRR